ncbi:AlpA family transcriptional regulator [Magnetovirga frankeli]|uniref:helix-turn-helix transcriptional regulator n=1 Tax=Magnetovirga frankeli TaxID=947516 RepID=UPI001293D65C|nr:AlpA family transcriptional regulator [gamma proteobacterium SS-5]
MQNESQYRTRLIRRREVERLTGLSRSSIYARLKPNPNRPSDFDPDFPRPVQLGPKAVGWVEGEVLQWVEGRIAASRDKECGQ